MKFFPSQTEDPNPKSRGWSAGLQLLLLAWFGTADWVPGCQGHGGFERLLVVSSRPTEQVLGPPPRPQRPQRARSHRVISGANLPVPAALFFPSASRSKHRLPQPNSLQPMPSWSVDGRRTARSRSSGWPRRESSRRARPAKSSGRYRIGAPLLWILCAVVNLGRVFFVLRVQELDEIGVPVGSVKIRYSPFSRTTETARVVAGVLGIPFEAPSCEVS